MHIYSKTGEYVKVLKIITQIKCRIALKKRKTIEIIRKCFGPKIAIINTANVLHDVVCKDICSIYFKEVVM